MPNLIDIAQFREAAKTGKAPGSAVCRVTLGEAKAIDESRRAVRFCFSDNSVDRVGDTIAAEGWVTDAFMKNPVALWAHDSFSPPIGKASNLAVENGRLMGDIEFMPAEVYGFADTIYRMVLGKYLNAVSVGFVPIKYQFVENDPSRGWGIDFLEQELLEISVCPVPANANALAEARAKGIDTRPLVEWAEKVLDGGGRIVLPRSEVEQLRIAAKGADMARTTKRIKDDGMREDDPASGGAVVATCGRSADQECGMQDPEECSVHRTKDVDQDDEESKRLRAMLRSVVRAELKRLRLAAKKKAEGDPDGEEAKDEPDHMVEMKRAHFHAKMAKVCRDAADEHHDENEKCLRRAIKALEDDDVDKDDDPADQDPDDDAQQRDADPDDDNDEEAKAKAAAKAKVRQLMRGAAD